MYSKTIFLVIIIIIFIQSQQQQQQREQHSQQSQERIEINSRSIALAIESESEVEVERDYVQHRILIHSIRKFWILISLLLFIIANRDALLNVSSSSFWCTIPIFVGRKQRMAWFWLIFLPIHCDARSLATSRPVHASIFSSSDSNAMCGLCCDGSLRRWFWIDGISKWKLLLFAMFSI